MNAFQLKQQHLLSLSDQEKVATLLYLYKHKNLSFYRRSYRFDVEYLVIPPSQKPMVYKLNIPPLDSFELVTCRKEALPEEFDENHFNYALLGHYVKEGREMPEVFQLKRTIFFEVASEVEELTEEDIISYPQLIESLKEEEVSLIDDIYF